MNSFKCTAVLAACLFPTLSFAELVAGNTRLDNQQSTTVSVSFQQEVIGDLYVAVEVNNEFLFLEAEGFSGTQAVPFSTNQRFLDDIEILPVNAQGITPGKYTLYQVVSRSNQNPFLSENWLTELSSLTFNINLNPAVSSGECDNNGCPEPGSGQFGFEPNTPFSGYFAPKLIERTLGDYTNVVNSKDEWDALSPSTQEETLYWTNNGLQLKGLFQGNDTVFDDLRLNSYIPPIPPTFNNKLTIAEPLSSGATTGYPGCVGVPDLLVHVRQCGEVNPKVIIGSEIFSQRWTRLDNVIVTDSNDEYHLNAQIIIDRILPIDILLNFPLFFEMSVSKVPGDFSENTCKADSAVQYSSNRVINLTQKGFATNLPIECQVDSAELQHYYVNVRSVNIDQTDVEISNSLCNSSSGCKFELDAFLD